MDQEINMFGKTYQCYACDRTFDFVSDCERHELTEHPIKKVKVFQKRVYVCGCGKQYQSSLCFDKHTETTGHIKNGEYIQVFTKPYFSCDTCDMTFLSRKAFENHNDEHEREIEIMNFESLIDKFSEDEEIVNTFKQEIDRLVDNHTF